tara:strand:- start:1588 stop:1866 length:279 start_codon:yes stop_codon:yes gene_type:complete
MAKTKRYAERIVKLLEEMGEANAHQIYDYLAEKWVHSPTMSALGNILSKDKRFSKVGKQLRKHNGSHYEIIIWGLRGENENAMDREIQTEND